MSLAEPSPRWAADSVSAVPASFLWIASVASEDSTTTTVAVPRIVGQPLPSWVVLAASAALLAAIVIGGLVVSRRNRVDGDRR